MRPHSLFIWLCILVMHSSAQSTSDFDAADNSIAAYTSLVGKSLTVTMFPGMEPFSLSPNSEGDFSLKIGETLVYENITSLSIE